MMRSFFTLCCSVALASALRVAPSALRVVPCVRVLFASTPRPDPRLGLVTMAEEDDELEERFGSSTEAAEGLELMQQFNSRLDAEGGANMFKLKTTASNVGESVTDSANQAKRVGEDAVAKVEGAFNGLTTQQRNIATIILGLIAFQILISLIGNLFGDR